MIQSWKGFIACNRRLLVLTPKLRHFMTDHALTACWILVGAISRGKVCLDLEIVWKNRCSVRGEAQRSAVRDWGMTQSNRFSIWKRTKGTPAIVNGSGAIISQPLCSSMGRLRRLASVCNRLIPIRWASHSMA